MKKSVWVVVLSVIFAAVGCTYDDSGLQKKVTDLDKRVSQNELDIKDLQAKINGDVKTYKDLVDALLKADYVKGVTSEVGEDGITVYTIKFSQAGDVVIRAKGDKGDKGDPGNDGEDGNDGNDGDNGITPHIGDNGNWWIGETDTQIPATGDKGDKGDKGDVPYIGTNGNWWVGETDTQVAATGPAGVTPEVTIELGDDGVYYWKVNGEILKDGNGNPLRVTAITPVFKIDDTSWWVSYDGKAIDDATKEWVRVGLVADTGATVVEVDADSSDEYVILTINGKAVNIPKEKAFALVVKFEGDLGSVGVEANSTLGLAYEITGVKDTETTTVDVLSTTAGISAKVSVTDNKSGYILITTTDVTSGKIFVYADNNAGKTSIKSITLEEGVLKAVVDVQQVPVTGGTIDVEVETNMEYNVFIPDGIDWAHVILPTKATHIDNVQITVDPNPTTAYRYTTVTILNAATSEVVKVFDVIQQPGTDAATDLVSVAELPDDTPVVLSGVTTVAVSKTSAIVIDGTNPLYAKADGLAINTVYNLSGIKKTDALGFAYVEVSAVDAPDGATPADYDPNDFYYYYGYGANGLQDFYTAVNGLVTESAGVYYVNTPLTGEYDNYTGEISKQIFVLEDPLDSFGLDALVGEVVALTGWTHAVNTENGAEDIITIPTSVHKITFASYDGWVPSYDGVDAEGYDALTNTVASPIDGDYYTLFVSKKAELDEVDDSNNKLYPTLDDFILAKAISASDDLLFNLTYYGMRGYNRAEIFDVFAHADTETDQFNPLDYDEYVLLAVGLDGNGLVSGKYALVEFEKKDPAVKAAYEDFLGEWVVGNSSVTLTEKVSGSTYYFYAPGSSDLGVVAEAVYDPDLGRFYVVEQDMGASVNDDTYGALNIYFSGLYYYSSRYPSEVNYPQDTDVAGQRIFTGAMLPDGTVDLRPGKLVNNYSADGTPAVGFAYSLIIASGQYAGYVYSTSDKMALPAVMKEPEASPEFLAWIGDWDFYCPSFTDGTDSLQVRLSIQQKAKGISYDIINLGTIYTQYPSFGNTIPAVATFNSDDNTLNVAVQTNSNYGITLNGTIHLVGNSSYPDGYYGIGLTDGNSLLKASMTDETHASIAGATYTIQQLGGAMSIARIAWAQGNSLVAPPNFLPGKLVKVVDSSAPAPRLAPAASSTIQPWKAGMVTSEEFRLRIAPKTFTKKAPIQTGSEKNIRLERTGRVCERLK